MTKYGRLKVMIELFEKSKKPSFRIGNFRELAIKFLTESNSENPDFTEVDKLIEELNDLQTQ